MKAKVYFYLLSFLTAIFNTKCMKDSSENTLQAIIDDQTQLPKKETFQYAIYIRKLCQENQHLISPNEKYSLHMNEKNRDVFLSKIDIIFKNISYISNPDASSAKASYHIENKLIQLIDILKDTTQFNEALTITDEEKVIKYNKKTAIPKIFLNIATESLKHSKPVYESIKAIMNNSIDLI